MKTITGAQIVIESLLKENTTIIFGYPGGGIMPIYDALYDYDNKIEHILTRHEQGAIHAAEGYAKASGTVGVCFATSGPGATNLITGLADAIHDSIPLVCITGQVPTALLNTQAFQEVDIISISKTVTKWNYQVKSPEEIAPTIAKAFRIARSGRPGPVLIDIPKDIQFASCQFTYTKQKPEPKRKIQYALLKQAATLLNEAKRPLILLGNGVRISGAQTEVCKLAGRAGIPVAVTLHGLSSFHCHHELYKGLVGMHGNYAVNMLTNEADVILAIGVRFGDRVTGNTNTYAKQAKIIHIDISTHEIDKLVPSSIAIHADAKDALEKLNLLIKRNTHTDWVERFDTLTLQEQKQVIDPEVYPTSGEIRMAEVVHLLSEKTKGKAIIIADVGQHQMATARYYRFNTDNSFITSGGLGTMGFALPAAIGAKKARPDTEVIAIMGDGGIQMNIQELGTIMQEHLPIKILVFNNNYLGLVRQWQEMFFDKRYSYVDLVNPTFTTIADGYHIKNKHVSKREHLADTIETFLNTPEAYLLDVHVKQDEKVFPMVPSGASVDQVRLS